MARPQDVQDYIDKIEEMLLDENIICRIFYRVFFLRKVIIFQIPKQGVDNIKNSVKW